MLNLSCVRPPRSGPGGGVKKHVTGFCLSERHDHCPHLVRSTTTTSKGTQLRELVCACPCPHRGAQPLPAPIPRRQAGSAQPPRALHRGPFTDPTGNVRVRA